MAGGPSENPPQKSAEKIRGRDWHKEVGGVTRAKQKVREEFYRERAKFKLKVDDSQLKKAKEDPKAVGIMTREELEAATSKLSVEVKKGFGITLARFLDEYFTTGFKITDPKRVEREVNFSLYLLSNFGRDVKGRKINVDLLRMDDKITCSGSTITIKHKNGEVIVDGQSIR